MKKRRFAEGGGTSDEGDAYEGMMQFQAQNPPAEAPAEITEKRATFKEAFADARRAGDKTFEWNGKKYSTDLAAPKAAAPKVSSTAAADFQRADKAEPKLKYQSLQDRAADYEAKRKESGVGMYGTRKSVLEPRSVMKIDKKSMEPTGMGSIQKYAKGGAVKAKGWGVARGARAAKIV